MDLGQPRLFCSVCFTHTLASGRQYLSVNFANSRKISVHLIFRHSNAFAIILMWDTTFTSAQRIYKILPIPSKSLTSNTIGLLTADEWKYNICSADRNRARVEMVRQHLCKRTFESDFHRIARYVFNLC